MWPVQALQGRGHQIRRVEEKDGRASMSEMRCRHHEGRRMQPRAMRELQGPYVLEMRGRVRAVGGCVCASDPGAWRCFRGGRGAG